MKDEVGKKTDGIDARSWDHPSHPKWKGKAKLERLTRGLGMEANVIEKAWKG